MGYLRLLGTRKQSYFNGGNWIADFLKGESEFQLRGERFGARIIDNIEVGGSSPLGLRFRAEFFNIFNHPNFGNPNNDLSQPPTLFGHSIYQIGGPRSIQLALKLQF